jgi:hypothetical protein
MGWASGQVPAIERKPTVSRLSRSRHVTAQQTQGDADTQRYARDRRLCAGRMQLKQVPLPAQNVRFWHRLTDPRMQCPPDGRKLTIASQRTELPVSSPSDSARH